MIGWWSALLLLVPLVAAVDPHLMVWMCLERCFGATPSDVRAHVKELVAHKDVVDSVSVELFNLGPNSTLVTNALSDVAPALQAAGLPVVAMLSSYPYPPDFAGYLRQLFRNPQPFIDACVAEAQRRRLAGFNVDWEPTSGVEPADRKQFAQFLAVFAGQLRARANATLTVAYATWSALYDVPLLNQAYGIERLYDMSTYASNNTSWQTALKAAVRDVSPHRLGVGLMTYKLPNNESLSESDVKFRIDKLISMPNDVQALGIWVAPLPAYWWPHLARWKEAVRAASSESGDGAPPSRPDVPCSETAPCTAENEECSDRICVCRKGTYPVHDVCTPAEALMRTPRKEEHPLSLLAMLAIIIGSILLLTLCCFLLTAKKRAQNRFTRLRTNEAAEVDDGEDTDELEW